MASFQKILAVDLGASAVRLVELGPDGKGRPTILALSQEEIPFDPGKTSDFFPIYAQALTAAVGRLPGKTRLCHLCLGGPAVFARILKVPASDPAKVGSMIGFEAQQTVPAIEQALWDYQVVPSPTPNEVEALILAIKRETVDELSAAAASAGLKPQAVTLTPSALLNAFSFNYPEASGCNLIMEVSARATTILLVEGSRIFVRGGATGGSGHHPGRRHGSTGIVCRRGNLETGEGFRAPRRGLRRSRRRGDGADLQISPGGHDSPAY